MTKKIGELEVSVTQIELENGISAGIHWRALTEDMVPAHEEHEARLERGLRLREWEEMHYTEKALIIAARRIRMAVRNLQSEAEGREMERRAKRKK